MAVARGHDGDAGREVQITVAVDVFDHRARATLDDEWIVLAVVLGHHAGVALDDRPGPRPRRRHADPRVVLAHGSAHDRAALLPQELLDVVEPAGRLP